LRFNSDTQARFFAYFVAGLQKLLLLEWGKQGAMVESTEHEYLGNSPFPLPPECEQRTIAAFLDYETARIDRLIARQQRLIELLKEKRQAVISHAITKGLPSINET
jgi:type I restriction enzyme S subunit